MNRRQSIAYRKLAEAAHDLLRGHCRDFQETEDVLAAEIGIAAPTLNGYANGHAPLPMDVAARLEILTGRDDIGQAYARLTNRLLVAKPCPDEHPEAASVVRETGDVLVAYSDAIADGVITEDEAERLCVEIEEAQTALETMKQRVVAAVGRAPQMRFREVM